ncbi:hypothetical protein M3M35_06665 [Fructilactobacillus myrtifloralis]|uniref:HipA-like kinase domain-containing protein n=1 Tax=Fructilactobacillus myrtifloralis TaxID=2940301 RepID=A0ABY5BPF8_9LACO|nr:HipA family kinase [Fructilactobacillus myrtifloralis]USS84968.1 hypothetical protein M3M35_06665 [Fructilactobacillus myrtifloralis]
MINIIEIVSINKLMNAGVTKPVLASANNKKLYILKTFNNYTETYKFAFNELISSRIAKKLGLPILNFDIANLSNEAIKSCNDEKISDLNICSGPCFAVEYTKGITNINPLLISSSSNKDDIPGILLFDELMLNEDRYSNPGNLIYNKKNKKIYMIDHTHIIRNGLWTNSELIQDSITPPLLIELEGQKYFSYLNQYIHGNSPFDGICQKINKLKDNDFENFFINIPSEWSIPQNEIDQCKKFVKFRFANYNGILNQIRYELPGWKGGENNET